MAREDIERFMQENEVTVDAMFVPFSKSRNKLEEVPNLNWVVVVKRAGRPILTTDYMAGRAHCPGYKAKVPQEWDRHARYWSPSVCGWECENGYRASWTRWGGFRKWGGGSTSAAECQPIKPDACSVLACLALDAFVIDAGGFEAWAADYGYDIDSREAEKIYKACLETALKLRGGLGEMRMRELAEACQDF